MPKKDYEHIETIRRKVSMAGDIVENKDPDYAYYSGANWEIASKIAKVDVLLRSKLIPEKYLLMVKLYRAYLQQQRKAFFASVRCDIVSQLGFIQGDPRKSLKASATIENSSRTDYPHAV